MQAIAYGVAGLLFCTAGLSSFSLTRFPNPSWRAPVGSTFIALGVVFTVLALSLKPV